MRAGAIDNTNSGVRDQAWLPQNQRRGFGLAGKYHKWSKSELHGIASRYTRWADLDREENLAAQAIRRHGLYDELCSHMDKRVVQLTEADVRVKARLCATRTEFYHTYPSEYSRALDLGIIDDVGLPLQRRQHTDASLASIAAQYRTLKEFYRKDNSAYQTANRRGILYDICEHMEEGGLSGYQLYLYEFPDGVQYVGITSRRERHSKGHRQAGPVFEYARDSFDGVIPEPVILGDDLSALEAARRERAEIKDRRERGLRLLNKAKGGSTGGSPYAHSEESVRHLAAQYASGVQFRKHQPAAANWARNRGIQLEFPHDTESRTRWTEENIWNAVHQCTSYSEFVERYPSARLAAERIAILPHIHERLPPRKAWTDEQKEKTKRVAIEAAQNYATLKEFRKAKPDLYSIAYRAGLLDEIEAKGTTRVKRKRYVKRELAEIAKGYHTRVEFQKGHPSAYQSALKQGFLDKICTHMEPQKQRWNRDTILSAAKEWQGGTISEFIRATGGLYNKAKRLGMWEEVKMMLEAKSRI